MAKIVIKTKSQIIAAVAEKAEITKTQAKTAISALLDLAYAGAKQEAGFTIPGLGKLILVKRKKMIRPDPRNPGKTMVCPAKKVVKFRLAKAAKDAILPPPPTKA